MGLPDEPTVEEIRAWDALTFDPRVLRIVLVKIQGRAVCHLGVTVSNPKSPLPRTLSFRGSLGEILTEALVELETTSPKP